MSLTKHGTQCHMIYASMILHNFLTVHDNSTWSQIAFQHNQAGIDDEIAAWQATHEKVMCAACRNCVPQVLYCVHTDLIAHQDQLLASSYMMHGSRGVGRAVGRRVGVMDMQRDRIADDLWSEFMLTHLDFDGVLSDQYMRAD